MRAQSCPTLCDPMECSLPGSSVHGIFQARILEWVAVSFSRGSSQPRNQTCISQLLHCRQIFYHWATGEAQKWCKKDKIRDVYKALGFDKKITLNMALKACVILPGPIVQGGWAVLQNQENEFQSPKIIYPQKVLQTLVQVILQF